MLWSLLPEEMKLCAVRDFDPKHMSFREKMQLNNLLQCLGLKMEGGKIELSNTYHSTLKEYSNITKEIDQNIRHKHGFDDTEYTCNREVSDLHANKNLPELAVPIQDKQINPEKELMVLENKSYINTLQGRILIEHLSVTNKICESYIIHGIKGHHQRYIRPIYKKKEQEHTKEGVWHLKRMDLCAVALTFKRGNKIETIPPVNIG